MTDGYQPPNAHTNSNPNPKPNPKIKFNPNPNFNPNSNPNPKLNPKYCQKSRLQFFNSNKSQWDWTTSTSSGLYAWSVLWLK